MLFIRSKHKWGSYGISSPPVASEGSVVRFGLLAADAVTAADAVAEDHDATAELGTDRLGVGAFPFGIANKELAGEEVVSIFDVFA